MQRLLLLGNEAVAQGALDAGLSGVYAYPGTPSTEITEYIQASVLAKERGVHCEWSANEKTAFEAALGMSYAGKRSMVCMKHVGLNVAADPFINSAITGINGGMLVVVADDPSMHSSQNEQDSRFYGKFAMIPVLEPSNQQEAYDMTYTGFNLSEKYKLPVMLRLTTRLAHSRSGINRSPLKEENNMELPGNQTQFILLPAMARQSYKKLLSGQQDMEMESEKSVHNQFMQGPDKSLGIITCGIAYNYLLENFQERDIPYPVLKIAHYPVPKEMVKRFVNNCSAILVLEEGYPLLEEMLSGIMGIGKSVHGRLDHTIPRDGELNPDIVAEALSINRQISYRVPDIVKNRPPALCKGCSHADLFRALNEAMTDYGKGRVFSDIGCYTLGALPPFETINSCVDMGASVTMAKGAADAGLFPSVCVIGDSTFTHSGMTGLLDAVHEKSFITVIISDNSTTAMTGGQNSVATGRLENICKGLGVEPDHLRILIPLRKNHNDNVKIIRDELNYKGVSVIISQRECIQTATRKKKQVKEKS